MTNWEKQNRIRNGLPIELFGVDFYPILMKDYEEFCVLKNTLLLRMTSLPPQYMSYPFISALWCMEMDTIAETGKPIGMFLAIMRLLSMSLRLDNEESNNLLKNTFCNPDKPNELVKIVLKDKNKNPVDITPLDFGEIRQLIAELNGLALPDDADNPDLLEAEEVLNEKNSGRIEYDTNTLISSVAYLSHIDEREINSWTIRQFEARREAIDRDKYFMLYAQAEMGGMVKFSKGNPVPSWCFNARKGLTIALKGMDEMADKMQSLGNLNQIVGE